MMLTNNVSTVIASSYIADPEEIEQAEIYYTKMEAELQQQINQMEAQYPGKDEYRFNIGAIGHDPHTLISYLTAKYGDFTFSQVKGELESLFSEQYGIRVEETTETREETRTIRVGESLGNVVTSGYCNCPICCGVWSGGPTASGAMPQANHTIAVDAANPFLPMGTKVVMNGVDIYGGRHRELLQGMESSLMCIMTIMQPRLPMGIRPGNAFWQREMPIL